MKYEMNYDVVVVGRGPAGVGAALASVRNGAKTILIEKNGVLGGQMTSGLVIGFHGMREFIRVILTLKEMALIFVLIMKLSRLLREFYKKWLINL